MSNLPQRRVRGRTRSFTVRKPCGNNIDEWAMWILVMLYYDHVRYMAQHRDSRGRPSDELDVIFDAMNRLDPVSSMRSQAKWLK